MFVDPPSRFLHGCYEHRSSVYSLNNTGTGTGTAQVLALEQVLVEVLGQVLALERVLALVEVLGQV